MKKHVMSHKRISRKSHGKTSKSSHRVRHPRWSSSGKVQLDLINDMGIGLERPFSISRSR